MSIFVPNICGDETSYVLLFYKHITKFLTIKKKYTKDVHRGTVKLVHSG